MVTKGQQSLEKKGENTENGLKHRLHLQNYNKSNNLQRWLGSFLLEV